MEKRIEVRLELLKAFFRRDLEVEANLERIKPLEDYVFGEQEKAEVKPKVLNTIPVTGQFKTKGDTKRNSGNLDPIL